ncbi:MAG: hypothetical protein Q9187_002226 [Circinaria calcarea]
MASKLPRSSAFDNIVIVLIGREKVKFELHKGLLMYYSEYFRGAFNGSFKEAEENTVHLPEEKVEVFKLVNSWLYTRHLADTLEKETSLAFGLLLGVFLFGERRIVRLLQNDTIDIIIRKCTENNKISPFIVKAAYENTPTSSPIRKLLVHIAVHRSNPDFPSKHSENYPKEYLIDVVAYMKKLNLAGIETWTRDWSFFVPSNYHLPVNAAGTVGNSTET